jgi:hypothetical protein
MVQVFHRPLNLDKALGVAAKLLYEMPRPTSFGKDTGLQVRMAFTFFLLGRLYVVFGAVLEAALKSAVPVIIIHVGLAALQLFTSVKLALAARRSCLGIRAMPPEIFCSALARALGRPVISAAPRSAANSR